jgi:hypothetical protein
METLIFDITFPFSQPVTVSFGQIKSRQINLQFIRIKYK